MAAAILEARGLTKTFGAVAAASNITIEVAEDTVVGLIGGNGAGKTTFINLITGYLKPTSGSIRYRGREITGIVDTRDAAPAAETILARFGLAPFRDAVAGVLPEGVRKLLDISMALVMKPRLLLLDEPTSGVSAGEDRK